MDFWGAISIYSLVSYHSFMESVFSGGSLSVEHSAESETVRDHPALMELKA